MRIAVTGNIGCGKTTVMAELRRLMPGVAHFNFDEAVRELYSADENFRCELRKAFGTEDRAYVASAVFQSPSAMNQLNDITRKPLMQRLRTALRQERILIEFPLLFEMAECIEEVDFVIAVVCDEATQRERVARRDRATPEKIDGVLASQFHAATKAALADFVIDTSPGAEPLSAQLSSLMRVLRRGELRQRALKEFPPAVWEQIEAAYTEPHRHYHGLDHLWWMFEEYDRFEGLITHPGIVRSSIWFHDIRCDVDLALYPTNEARSANTLGALCREHMPDALSAVTYLAGGLPVGTVGLVAEFIMCTKGHTVSSPFLRRHPELLADANLFLDIDLSILGAPAAVCDLYDANIRREFSAVPEKLFATERAKVLENFIGRERLFFSDAFADREGAARDNLGRLIAKWRATTADSTLNAQAE